MRTTMQMMGNTALRNILNNSNSISKIQNQMGKGQRVVNPSDDPLATNEGIRLQTLTRQASQFQTNISVAQSYLGLSDSVLQSVNDLVKTTRGTVVGLATETTTPDMRRNTAPEIENALKQLVMLGNRSIGGRYIFGGSETEQEPFSIVGTSYVCFNGNEEDVNIQADHSNYVPMNAKASDIFGSLVTRERSKVLSPYINMDVNTSTNLKLLNSGGGVANGSIHMQYSANPANGIEVDLRKADTLEDVADMIMSATNNVVTVRMNATQTGLELVDTGGVGMLKVSEVASNTVATNLGILGSVIPASNTLTGSALLPAIGKQTLLADVPGYYGTSIGITNGPEEPSDPTIRETRDVQNMLSNFKSTGTLAKGVNTGSDGELFFNVYQDGMTGNRVVEVYRDANMKAEDMVGKGELVGSNMGLVTINSVNSSGFSATVELNYTGTGDDNLQYDVEFPESFTGTVQVEAFREANDATNQLSAWQIHGLRKGIDTSIDDKIYVAVQQIAGPQYQVTCYRDAAHTTPVAQGVTSDPTGTVNLSGVGIYTHLSGSVNLEYVADTPAGVDVELTPTYATVEDLQNAVQNSNTYTKLEINAESNELVLVSQLSGAYLHVSDNGPVVDEVVPTNPAMAVATPGNYGVWNIRGLSVGSNTDPNGMLYTEYVGAFNGTDYDYTVQVYKDAAHTSLVASGTALHLPLGPFAMPLPVVTLVEQNGSGLSGSVELANST